MAVSCRVSIAHAEALLILAKRAILLDDSEEALATTMDRSKYRKAETEALHMRKAEVCSR